MASTNDPKTRVSRIDQRRDGIVRFTVEEFARLADLGFFGDRNVELIRGLIFEMTQDPGHATASELTGSILRGIFRAGWIVREAKPLDLGRRSLPEPDFAVVAGSIRDFGSIHPTTTALIVEISEATLRKDRTVKAHLYAQAGLAEYWIVNLIDRQVEVHRSPGPDPVRTGRFRYAEVTVVPESGRISPLAAPGSEIAVADLLP